MAELAHRFVTTNGIRMHYVEAGRGPLVILCHGFPESWYSWRHQIGALADAGFRAVAPEFYPEAFKSLEASVPNLKKKVLLKGAGHWIQQERPAEVNRLLIEFLKSL
jgi:pimeloyl-ACP methyl ester carboxylesterase